MSVFWRPTKKPLGSRDWFHGPYYMYIVHSKMFYVLSCQGLVKLFGVRRSGLFFSRSESDKQTFVEKYNNVMGVMQSAIDVILPNQKKMT